jgi:hypothetical protein
LRVWGSGSAGSLAPLPPPAPLPLGEDRWGGLSDYIPDTVQERLHMNASKSNSVWNIFARSDNVVSTVVGVIGILTFFVNWLPSTDVRYIRTPVLKTNNVFVQGIMLINKGERAARDIVLSIDYKNTIIDEFDYDKTTLQIQKSLEGGKGNDYITVSFGSIPEKSKGFIYITLKERPGETEPTIKASYNEGKIIREDVYERTTLDIILRHTGLVAFFWLLFGVIHRLWQNLRGGSTRSPSTS